MAQNSNLLQSSFINDFQKQFYYKLLFSFLVNSDNKSLKKMKSFQIFLLCLIIKLMVGFRLNQIDYDVSQSREFQSYCVITHCSKDLLVNWTCKLCPQLTPLEQRIYIQNQLTNVVALVGYHRPLNSIVMVFRGTEDVKNWLEDFSFNQVPYPRCKNCKIHEGFYASYLSISLQLSSAIQNLRKQYPNSKMISLGSSLGAALANIAALELQVLYGGVQQLHTFGCPRVGEQNFVQYLSKKMTKIRRVVHNKDIVPHIPLISQNFVHPAFELWFDEEMKEYKICNQSGEDQSCSDSLYPNFSIEDHISYWQKPTTSEICQ